MLSTWLFVDSPLGLASLLLIVLLAGIVRGAIGFGFSALVIASCSFWLPPVAVICLVILLEGAASLFLLSQTKAAINVPVLWRITISGSLSCAMGVLLLATINEHWLTVFITVYLATISILSLMRVKLKTEVKLSHYTLVGFIAGLLNGTAGVGGLFLAFFMNATQANVSQLRATISASFLFSEFVFLIMAVYQDLYTVQIVVTAAICLIPLWIGTKLGSICFNFFTESQLKRGVLVALIVLSVIGLAKTLISAL